MFRKNFLTRIVLAAKPSTISAEIKTYTGAGEYIMCDYETPEVAKQRSKIYLQSYSEAENFEFEVFTITAGILKILGVDYKIIPMEEYGRKQVAQVNRKAQIKFFRSRQNFHVYRKT